MPNRREIRDLTPDQWRRVVRAMWKMKTTNDVDGKKTFGSNFLSYDTLHKLHQSASLNPIGDQMHFGPMFGPTHRAWLLLFEHSLLAVDPRIDGLPYWDFRRDALKTHESIFTNKYLGSKKGTGEGYTVIDGSFARWPTTRDGGTTIKGTHTNAYGYLRHPLSMNKAPYNTRNGGSICGYPLGLGNPDMWEPCLLAGNILDWTACVDGNLHGATHSSVAGSWVQYKDQATTYQCAQWFGFIAAPSAPYQLLSSPINRPYQLGSFISPYSLGCFSCPKCTADQPLDECVCTVKQSKCGPTWTSLRAGSTFGTNLRGGSSQYKVNLAPSDAIHILGDMGDPAGSVNEPLFVFHHANMDRHFELWTQRNAFGRSRYWGYPTSGLAPGCNLNDIANGLAPFTNLDPNDLKRLLTMRDLLEKFTLSRTPYTYDSPKSAMDLAANDDVPCDGVACDTGPGAEARERDRGLLNGPGNSGVDVQEDERLRTEAAWRDLYKAWYEKTILHSPPPVPAPVTASNNTTVRRSMRGTAPDLAPAPASTPVPAPFLQTMTTSTSVRRSMRGAPDTAPASPPTPAPVLQKITTHASVRRSMRGALPTAESLSAPTAITIGLCIAVPVIFLLVYACLASFSRRRKATAPPVRLRVAVPRGGPVVSTGSFPTIVTTATATGIQPSTPFGLRCRTPVSTPATTPLTTSP